jgi:hypothetical protein
MPLLDNDTQEKERHRSFRGSDAHDAYALTYGLPHDGFGVVEFETDNVSRLLSNSVLDAYRYTGYIAYESSLGESESNPSNRR